MSSILLVTTLFCFTIFTTPKTILNVVASLEINNEREGLRSPEMRLAYSVCNVLFTVNYSCNFYFYCCANKDKPCMGGGYSGLALYHLRRM